MKYIALILIVLMSIVHTSLSEDNAVLPRRYWDGMVGYYTFDSNEKVVKDKSLAGHDGNVVGSPEWSDGHWTFNGKDSRIFVDSNLGLADKNITIFCNVQIPSKFMSGPFVMVGGYANGYSIGVGNNSYDAGGNTLLVVYHGVQTIISSKKLTPHTWYQLRLFIDRNGNPSLYINGLKDGRLKYDRRKKPIPPKVIFESGLHIGGCKYLHNYGAGYYPVKKFTRCKIDDVIIFNKAISGLVVRELRKLRKN